MAESVKIANLQIEISDNSKTTVQSLNEFIKSLNSIKDASKNGAGLGKVASGLDKVNKSLTNGGLDGLASLAEALTSSISPAEQLASALERVAQANRSIKQSGGLQSAVKNATKLQAQATPGNVAPNRGRADVNPTEATSGIARTQESVAKVSAEMEALQSRMARARDTLAQIQMRDDLAQKVREWTSEFEKAPTALQRLATAMQPVTNAIKSIGQFGSNVFHTILPSGITRLINQFMRLAKMKVLRTIITSLLKGFSEGLQNAYQWAKLTGDQFALSMDTIATSMNYAKNTIGAAFATVLNAVAPIIDKLVDWLVTGINYINMFFSALGGSSTYVRAKKVAATYDGALGGIASGASGATGAVKELEEQLSVLDFDELNQLSEQSVPSYGGGGGGGGGTGSATPDYSNMFERVDIDSKIKNVADFFRENFETILDIVKAIGAGILAWKLANAFSNAISELSAMQKLGFATLVIGVVLSYEGGYDLGKNGFSVKGLVESIVGVGLAAIGGTMMWGVKGLVLGVTVSVIANIVGYIQGMREANEIKWLNELKDKSLTYRIALDGLDDATQKLSAAEEMLAHIKSLSLETDEELNKISIGQELLDQISKFEGKINLSATDMATLNGLVEAYNKLELTDVVKWWQDASGAVHTNVDEIQKAIDKYKEYAELQALNNLLIEASTTQAEAKHQRDLIGTAVDANQVQFQIAQERLNAYIAENYAGNKAIERWKPGDNPLGNAIAFQDKQLYQMMADVNAKYATTGQYQAAYNTYDQAYNVATEKVNYFAEQIGLATENVTGGLDNVATSSENASTNLDSIPSSVPHIFTGGLGISASLPNANRPSTLPDTLNTSTTNTTANVTTFSAVGTGAALSSALAYTGALKNVTTQEQINMAYQKAMERGYYDIAQEIQNGSNAGVYWTSVLTNINTETQKTPTVVNDAANRTRVYASAITDAGNASENSAKQTGMINTELNKVGIGVNYAGIANAISTNLGGQNFKGMGDTRIKNPIENQVNLIGAGVSGSTIYSKVGSLIGAQPFGKIGTSAKGNIEGQMNQTGSGVNANAIYGTVSKKSEAQPWANIGRMMAQQMAMGLESATLSMRYVMDAVYNGMVNSLYRTPWSSIGRYIGEEIKNGLRYIIGSFDFTVQVKANGKSYNVGGSARAYFASGGYPQAGTVFVAGEAGAEAVGTIGGKTGVANRDQIASAIAQALKPMLGSRDGRTETIEVNTYLDSAIIAKANAKGQVALKKQFNMRNNA